MGVAMDGTMVHVREEGWKELKIGCLFELGSEIAKDEHSGEKIEQATAERTSYVAHLGGPKPFGEQLWAEARRRKWDVAPDTQVLGDGATWIWNQAAHHFGDSHQVVDWYHAKEHLVAAVHHIHPQSDATFERCLRGFETLLYRGHARQLADALELVETDSAQQKEALCLEANYFRRNHRRMNYMQMREDQWVIGSGMVESGAKQFKHRFCGSGMRWSRQGLQNILPIRSAFMANRFDRMWQLARAAPIN